MAESAFQDSRKEREGKRVREMGENLFQNGVESSEANQLRSSRAQEIARMVVRTRRVRREVRWKKQKVSLPSTPTRSCVWEEDGTNNRTEKGKLSQVSTTYVCT